MNRCNACMAEFSEDDTISGEFCPECGSSNIFQRNAGCAVWPEIPVLQPITAHPVELTAPEFTLRRGL